MRFRRKDVSDDEYVKGIRRSVAFWERMRTWLIPLYVAGLVVVFWGAYCLIEAIFWQPANVPMALVGFVSGAALGFALGWTFHRMVYGLMESLGSAGDGFRTERLLLEHYKSSTQNLDEPEHHVCEDETEFEATRE